MISLSLATAQGPKSRGEAVQPSMVLLRRGGKTFMTGQRPRGVVAATATPLYPDFTPDHARLAAHCRALLDGGCDAINLLGTTGEANSFSTEERLAVMRAMAGTGLPLRRFLVGTGVCSLSETAQLTHAACEMGFAGALLLPPFYYPALEAPGLMAYVDALISRVDRPNLALYLYHIPQNTSVPWTLETVAELRERHPGKIVGLKDSAGDLEYAKQMARALPGFDVFPSNEISLAEANVNGFAGCISASVNLTAQDAQTCWSAQGTAAAGAAIDRAKRKRALLARKSLVASVKAALAGQYRDPEWARMCPPLLPLKTGEAAALWAELQAVR